jgi:hypothetical protein
MLRRTEHDRLAADPRLERPEQSDLDLAGRRQLLSRGSVLGLLPHDRRDAKPDSRPSLAERLPARVALLYLSWLTSARPDDAARADVRKPESTRRRLMTTHRQSTVSTAHRYVRRGLIVAGCVWFTGTTVAHMLRAGRREPAGARP